MPSRDFIAIRGDSVPLLLGPQGAEIEQEPSSTASLHSASLSATPSDPDPTQATTSSQTVSAQSSQTNTRSDTMTTTASTSTTTTSTTDSSSPTPSIAANLANDGPSQPSSIRFLVPVFLLIFITLSLCVYRKYRVIRRRRDAQANRPTPSREKGFSVPPIVPAHGPNAGWKEIRDYDDPWEVTSDDGKVIGGEQYDYVPIDGPRFAITAPSSPGCLPVTPSKASGLAAALSVTNLGWGWRESFSNWRSARSKEQMSCVDEGDATVLEEKRTIKLVQVSSTPYQSLPPLDLGSPIAHKPEEIYDLGGQLLDPPACDAEPKGSMRRLREKLALWRRGSTNGQTGLNHGGIDEKSNKRLERNKSPNKRRGPSTKPRMVRNDGAQDIGGLSLQREDTAPPSVPDWIRPRAASPTAMLSPPMQPHLFFAPNPLGGPTYVPAPDWESESEYSCATGSAAPTPAALHSEGLGPGYTTTPSRVNRQRSDKSTKSNKKAASEIQRTSQLAPPARRRSSKRDKPSSDRSPTIKRSNGLADLSAASPKQTRKEKRDARAKNEVEGILKASWTDRALASPQATAQDLSLMAGSQPLGSIGSVASMGSLTKIDEENRGGIEQILGMAKSP